MKKDQRPIAHHTPSVPDDNIIDADWVEIDTPDQQPVQSEAPSRKRSREGHWIAGGALVLLACGFVLDALTSHGSNTTADSNYVAEMSSSSDQVPEMISRGFEGPDDASMSPLSQLLINNDIKACSFPDNVDTMRKIIFPDTGFSPWPSITLRQYKQLAAVVPLALTDITAEGIDKDTHQVTCMARLLYGEGNSTMVLYQLRPSLQNGADAIMLMQPPPNLTLDILLPAISPMNNAAQPSADKANGQNGDGGMPSASPAAPPPTDKDLYEPH